jgi:hypothetical protein
MIEWTRQIQGARDAELNIPRTGPVTYHCAAKDEPASGLIFLIHGFGADANEEYSTKLRRFIAETSNLLAVTVEYHAYHARPATGALREIPPDTQVQIAELCRLHEVDLPMRLENLVQILVALDSKLKQKVYLKALLQPANGDYQNFGVLAALDHLAVLNDIIDQGFRFDRNRIVAMGSSHGGYIGHLLARFAPNTIAGLIDNSSYTLAHAAYLNQGAIEFEERLNNIIIGYNMVTRWRTGNPYHEHYFGVGPMMIRDTGNAAHMRQAAAAASRKCQYRMFNSIEDEEISPVGRKRTQVKNLIGAGFDATLREVGAADVDGELFKSLGHADVSLQKLFAHAIDSFAGEATTLDRDRSTTLAFECFDHVYEVRHSNAPPYLDIRVLPNPGY